MADFIDVTVDMNEAELKKLSETAMALAVQHGFFEFTPGVFLYDNKYLIEHQKTLPKNDTGKKTDYTKAPFWIVLQPEKTVSPCDDPMDVIDFRDMDEVDE
jgi:hypothetical protein